VLRDIGAQRCKIIDGLRRPLNDHGLERLGCGISFSPPQDRTQFTT
jgi:hypothetical protein